MPTEPVAAPTPRRSFQQILHTLPTPEGRNWIILFSLILWLASLALPALAFNTNPRGPAAIVHRYGSEMLSGSLFGPFEFNFAGLANPLLLLSWIFLHNQKFRRCYITLGFALFFALQTFQLYVLPFIKNPEVGIPEDLTHPLIGWYLWMAAILLPFAAAIHYNKLAKKTPPPPPPATIPV